jgi:hypothetical protein
MVHARLDFLRAGDAGVVHSGVVLEVAGDAALVVAALKGNRMLPGSPRGACTLHRQMNQPSRRRVSGTMGSMTRTAAVAATLTLALAGGANAADHRSHVEEVDPSAQDPTMAFVEFRDTAGESFPSPAYTLGSRDASGRVLGQQTFNPPYGFANTTEPFLIAGPGRSTRDAALTIPLTGARKVCFYRGFGTSDEIHCLSFDAVPDGQSAQRTSTGAVVFACPTPDAPNKESAGPCPGSEPGPSPVADDRKPGVVVTVDRAQRVRELRVSVAVDEQATLTVSGASQVAGRSVAYKKATRAVDGGSEATIRIQLTPKRLKTVKRALARGQKLEAKLKIVARDLAGNVAATKRTVRLKP